MKKLVILIFAFASLSAYGADLAQLLENKPYDLELGRLQRLDPQPLTLEGFDPDPTNVDRVKGLRVISKGRIFPLTYEIISIQDSKPETLEAISKSLDNHQDIVLKEYMECELSEKCLHYFHQVSENGKPHHVSSNYILLKNDIIFHLSATSYAALVLPRPSWGAPRPDRNSDDAAKMLMRSVSFK